VMRGPSVSTKNGPERRMLLVQLCIKLFVRERLRGWYRSGFNRLWGCCTKKSRGGAEKVKEELFCFEKKTEEDRNKNFNFSTHKGTYI